MGSQSSLARGGLYLCIVSEHNLPDLQACVDQQPHRLMLAVTPRFDTQARRFADVAKELLPECHVQVLEDPTYQGDTWQQASTWIQSCVRPALAAADRYSPRILNINGGTKPMAIALATQLTWDAVEYQAFGNDFTERFRLTDQSLPSDSIYHQSPVTPIAAAKLYGEVREIEDNLCNQHPMSGNIAARIWKGLNQADTALETIFERLQTSWFSQRDQNLKTVTLPLNVDSDNTGDISLAATLYWWQQLASLTEGCIEFSGDSVIVPGNRKLSRQANHWKRWVSGDWLERLAYEWICQVLPPSQVARNISLQTTDSTHSGREADLLLLHGGRTQLVEIKADLPTYGSTRAEHQLASMQDRFGKAEKVLFLGPQAIKRLSDQQFKSLQERCQGYRIELAWNQETLLQGLGLSQ